ncbi:unnamed protein product [Adineta ricciae]|uniref:Uncharacterized protein n=1 Tax=Adineta ricciae TaxID=249248 RepID=A0A815NZC5_ADIRI|nr:unnamed protein product [Adineta ricciae]
MVINIVLRLSIFGSVIFYSTNALSIKNNKTNQIDLCQQRFMTLTEVMELLKQQPCFITEPQQQQQQHLINGIQRRDVNNGNFDVHAIQTTINDHRVMINYLINNSINATFVADAISTYHSKTGPILTSWRDLVDLVFVCLLIGFLMYFLICRAGFAPCDKVLQCLFKPVVQRVQQQQQQKTTEPSTTIAVELPLRNKQQQPLHSSISDDFLRYNTGYLTE